jgi:hypothetical protein
MPTIEELHKKYMESRESDIDNFNYGDDIDKVEDNEFSVWHPVAKDEGFEKHIAKLKAMKQFNEGR